MALMYRVDLLERNLARLCNALEGMRAAVIVSDEASIALLLEIKATIGAALYAVKGAAQEIRVIPEGNASWTLEPDLDLGSIVPTGR